MKSAWLVAVAATLAGCAMMGGPSGSGRPGATATAMLEPTQGNATKGQVTFTQRGGKVAVRAEVSGLKPNAEHGFHVHEKGDCSSGDGMSTGGHFNPGGHPHGSHAKGGPRHAGDMPNLKADANGVARASFEVDNLSIGSGANDIVGKGLIVHVNPDDYTTQPTGNAGARLACAVIRKG